MALVRTDQRALFGGLIRANQPTGFGEGFLVVGQDLSGGLLVRSSPMAYLKAGALALLAALSFGAAAGIWRVLMLAFEHLRPEDRATVLASSISEAINTAAFLAILLVPIGFLVAFAVRRRRNRPNEAQLPE